MSEQKTKCVEQLGEISQLNYRLSKLLSDPQPGLFSWCAAYGRVMQDIVRFWYADKFGCAECGPMLLEALEAMLELHDTGKFDGQDPAEMARTAIAKANGEAG
jgi:hypothetical protein